MSEEFCNDYGDRPGCLGKPDPRYTMTFTDIGKGEILWCAFCGPGAQGMDAALATAFETRGPEFVDELGALIEQAEAERTRQ